MNAAGGHAAELAINQREVGENRQAQREQHRADRVSPEIELHDESQLSAKAIFDARHLAVVGFVIVAEQMQHAVKNQNL